MVKKREDEQNKVNEVTAHLPNQLFFSNVFIVPMIFVFKSNSPLCYKNKEDHLNKLDTQRIRTQLKVILLST